MKNIVFVLIAVMVMFSIMAVPVMAGQPKGVVQTEMVVHTDSGTNEMPAGTVVGSAILNTTASGKLIVVVNLDNPLPTIDNEAYDVVVHINNNKIIDQLAIDCLKVNAKGQGTANVKVDLNLLSDIIGDDDTEIAVSLSVRPSFSPNTTPCYVNGPAWKTAIMVPLK